MPTRAVAPQGFQVEALLDHNILAGLAGVASFDAVWQVSYDLKTWYPGPAATLVGREGTFTRERILLPLNGPRFARLMVRRTH